MENLEEYPESIPLQELGGVSHSSARSLSSYSKFISMKFNHSLQFNAVPEWVSKYVDYSRLKKLIYSLEKSKLEEEANNDYGDTEQQALINIDSDGIFTKAVDEEVEKIDKFYRDTETKSFEELDVLLADEDDFNKRNVIIDGQTANGDEPSATANSFLFRGSSRHRQQHRRQSAAYPTDSRLEDIEGSDSEVNAEPHDGGHANNSLRPRSSSEGAISLSGGIAEDEDDGGEYDFMSDYKITLKKRATNMYVSLCELRSFVQLNKTGFQKALKKYRKTLRSNLKEQHTAVASAYVFSTGTEKTLDDRINETISLYARLATAGNERLAAQHLRLQLREHVVWERNTVWRDMIGMERRTQAATAASNKPVGKTAADLVMGEDDTLPYVRLGRYRIPKVLFSLAAIKIVFIFLLFVTVLTFPVMESTEQNNCLALVLCASLLWATEAMPLFVTALLVPFIVVVLRIPKHDDSGERMTSEEASKFIFSQMWSSVIMLLLGGFTLAAALSKYDIAKRIATAILSRSGTNPKIVLLNLMFVAAFLSMWISNVAAPVLCYSISQPLLRTLPDGSVFAKALVFGIALASNIGGMISPIASPQNIIALENLHPEPSWGQWFAVSIPVSLVSLFLVWVLLLLTFRENSRTPITLGHVRELQDPFNAKQYFICGVTILTIVLWIFSHNLEGVFGEMGVTALVPIVLFFGTGLLSSEDFNNFLWTIIALAMGGIALGKAVSSSGLLKTIAHAIEGAVEGMSLYGVLLVFGLMILIVATFVSHTVAALIILPLVQSIGNDLPNPRPGILVMASALLCSAAMGLPTSGFPNVTAICMTDGLGRPYLTVNTFISRGIFASILVYLVVITVGFVMMNLAGF